MRVILFTETQALIKIINDICLSKDSYFKLLPIAYDNIKTLTLTSKDDLYVIDDAYFDTLDKDYLDLLKLLKVDVIVIVSKLSELAKYVGFNVIEYMYGTIDPLRLRLCLDRLYKRNVVMDKTRFNKLKGKILIRNKYDVTIVEVKDILYLKASLDYIQVYMDGCILISTDSLIFFEAMTTDAFFRIADDTIINFEKINTIKKMNANNYKINLIGSDDSIVMDDYLTGYDIDDEIQKKRKDYIVQTIKKIIN